MQNDNEKKINPKENHSQDSLLKVNLRQNENNTNNEIKKTVTATGEPINGIPGSKHTSEIGNSITNATNSNLRSEKPNEKTNDYKTASNIGFNSKKLPNHNIKEKPKQSSNKQSLEKSSEKKEPLDKSTKNPKNPNFDKNTGLKNPTKRLSSQKKYSKHAKNDENSSNNTSEANKQKKPFDGLKSQLANRLLNRNEKREETSENESEETTGQEVLNSIGGNIKQLLGIIAGFIGMTPFAISGLLIALVVIVICAIIVPIISSLSFYGEDDNGTVCFVASPCTSVILKDGNNEKKYALDEYIAGAIVNYYEHDDYAVMDTDVDQNLLKAFSVVIHSDIATYSDYDYTNETCTVNEESRFNKIYIPTIQNDTTNNDDTSSDNSDDSSSGEVDGVSGVDAGQNTQVSEEQPEEDEETKRKNDYYNKAKTAAESVITEVVDIYTQRLDIFYDGYKSTLGTSSATGSDYKKIIRDYIEGSPDYEEVTSNNDSDITEDVSTSEDDNTKDDNDGEVIGIYPVCHYQKDSSNNNGSIGTIVVNDLCSQVKVVDNMIGTGNGHDKDFSGVYSFDEFIAGVVANEIDSRWKQYPDILKAHAVAARTYLYNTVKYNKKAGSLDGDTCTITTSLSTMGFKPNTSAEITQAVQETSGEYIMVNGQISRQAQWDAFTYASKDSEYYYLKQKNLKVPIKWIESRISQGTISYNHQHSHGNGMSQWGAAYLVIEQGKNYKEVIQFFYDADIGKASTGYIMPINTFTYISGEIKDRCDPKHTLTKHNGIDFAAPGGTPVYAAHSGTVSKLYSTMTRQCTTNDACTGDDEEGIGVAIKNGDGTTSYYFHFSKRENLVVGQHVEAGQKIGEVGNTGRTTPAGRGYHLHYQMMKTGTSIVVLPRDYLPFDEMGYTWCYDPRPKS